MENSKKDPVKKSHHIMLTSHPYPYGVRPVPIHWGAPTVEERGPVVGTTTDHSHRNVIGAHSGSYSVYRALAIAAGSLDPDRLPDLSDTSPVVNVGPHPSWKTKDSIIFLDPWGHLILSSFQSYLKKGWDIRPSIAITSAHVHVPEIQTAIQMGRLKIDKKILLASGDSVVTKAAIEPVWYLPGIAERFACKETDLRRILFEQTGGMFPELITRPDLSVFLPPIGGTTVYIFGDPASISDPDIPLSVRVHDECNGSDVFGSDICTCRPYLVHAIELCIESAQKGGTGVVVYNRKEGRALGEVTKFLVYNARKRQKGGDQAKTYFERTECVAGVQDMRFQEMMPDVLHWLGITHIDRFISMSNMKFDAVAKAGIQIRERVTIPEDLVPKDAHVEIEAKKAAGYFTETPSSPTQLDVKGRGLNE
ncbi:MAG: GTP cyclohydrolase II [Oligoflexales bacterium]|nr:GTP cyclohydrolase II [Oligoflexales bacterium]